MFSRVIFAVVISLWGCAVHATLSVLARERPDYSIYHTENDLIAGIRRAVEQAPHMDFEMQSHTNTDNYTAELPVVTVSPTVPCEHDRLRVLLVFGEHAREFVSSELGLYLTELLGNLEQAALHFAGREWSTGDASEAQQLLSMLQSCVSLKIVPIENRGGRNLIERGGDLCERKNGNGVDPNRNWAVDWGKREKDYVAYEENAGTHAFSEPEPFLLREIVHTFQPHIWVNIHTGMEGLFMPFDHQAHIPGDKSSQDTLRLLKRLNEGACKGRCAVGSGGQQVGYLAHGTATDYVYLKGDAKIAMTWEIYGDSTASYSDCFKAFNPVTDEAFHALLQTWANAVFDMLLMVRDHPDFAALRLLKASDASLKDESLLARRFSLQPAGQSSSTEPTFVQYVWLVGVIVSFGSLAYILLRSTNTSSRSRRQYSERSV